MRITVIYSLPTRRALATPYVAADEDTKDSAVAVAKALSLRGVEAHLIPVSEDTIGSILSIRTDCVFNLIEWDGLDLPLALEAFGKLEELGVPFTGVSRATLSRIADKVSMKQALVGAGLVTPQWQLFESGKEPLDTSITLPVIVKPLFEHCSIGLTAEAVVEDAARLRPAITERIDRYQQPVFIEEFIIGREFQVTVLEEASGLTVLPPAEIVFTAGGTRAFLTYASRWIEGHPDYATSKVQLAGLSPALQKTLEDISRKAFRALNYRDYSRLDIRVRETSKKTPGAEAFILEANANPGLEDSDAYGMSISFRAAGLTFADFVWEIVASCLRRSGQKT